MNITQFTMEEVRCFAERQEFNIRPLTFLVGENSTGKTTALACFQALANYLTQGEIDFNSDPYSLGIFRDIVRNSKKKEKAFTLGFTFRYKKENVEWTVEFVEEKGGIEPVAKSVTVKFTDGEIILSADDTREKGLHLSSFDKGRNECCIGVGSGLTVSSPLYLLEDFAYRLLRDFYGRKDRPEGIDILANYLNNTEIQWSGIKKDPSVFNISPIRSRPKRTYDPTREFYDPEGSDVPMRLMRTQATDEKRWESLKGRLVEFGKSSGLFQDIDVRNLARTMGNPFQLKVKVRGPNSNVIDVGYGVSQILPVLVHILDPPISRQPLMEMPFFLLQQPEVHLHPRAQAALSSLLAREASQDKQSFIVETHSDYMIDRARIEIRKGNIRPEDVSLIYLEPKGNVVKVHNISFDKMGNMEGVPPHYGEFFMKEYRQLMGFED